MKCLYLEQVRSGVQTWVLLRVVGISKSGSSMGQSGNPMSNASTAALALGRSKGGLVKKKKSYKESLEIFEKKKELSIDDQMRISREHLLKRKVSK